MLVDNITLDVAIRDAVKSFRKNELAYLALTSKPEATLRDRIALRIRIQIARSKLLMVVAREFWKRVDLAVVDKTTCAPRVFVEMKCWHTANVDGLKAALGKDISKCRNVLAQHEPRVPTYVVLALIHQDKPVEPALDRVVKYQRQIRRAYRNRTSARVLAEYMSSLTSAFPGMRRLAVPTFVGKEFGVGVEIHWLVVTPGSRHKPAKRRAQPGKLVVDGRRGSASGSEAR